MLAGLRGRGLHPGEDPLFVLAREEGPNEIRAIVVPSQDDILWARNSLKSDEQGFKL